MIVPPHVVLITPGIVRNIIKQNFYLRIPSERDRPGRVHNIFPNTDLTLDAQDWYLVENNLIQLDRDKILKIIQFPAGIAPPVPPGSVQWVDGPTPPADTSYYWISSITGDYYVYDPTIGYWRSLSTKIIPFSRAPSRGTPLAPYGPSFTSYPLWVNPTVDRDYLVYRLYLYCDDGSALANPHDIELSSPGTGDQTVQAINKQTVQITPATRVIAPVQALSLRHGPALFAKYIHASVELTHIVSP